MTRIRVAGFGVSLDGYSAGTEQDLEHPLGKRGPELFGWFFPHAPSARCRERAAAMSGDLGLSWWREGGREVDFVLTGAGGLAAIEVQSGRALRSRASLRSRQPSPVSALSDPTWWGATVSALSAFLLEPAERWVAR